ncbi:unnamed protein product [Caenorhabditis auriculariae]|uniref:Essential MCU regulator, mitochondrial n=1 Tax=Caenorhabditis auriculariae TaxID=2777116 RepID=A0A8S1HDW4_9PELO|nr:unnamed protein product [Caenorhabditis auriculariae]
MAGAASIHYLGRALTKIASGAFKGSSSSVARPPSNLRTIAIPPPPDKHVMLKLIFVSATSLYIGGLIAHTGASFLEDYEIFVPAEDDDDD